MVPSDSGIFSEYREVTGTPPGKDMGLMGHRREANQPTRGCCAPHRDEAKLDLGRGRHPLSFSYSLSFPLSTSMRRKKRGAESY